MPENEAVTIIELANIALRFIHIAFGSIGLVVFWIPVFAKKGARLHIITGRMFEWCGYAVATSATIGVVWALSAPIQRYGITLEGKELEKLLSDIQFFFVLLGMLTVTFISSLRLGLLTVRTRKSTNPMGGFEPRFWVYLSFIVYALGAAYGAFALIAGSHERNIVICLLGIILFSDTRKNLAFVREPTQEKMGWWYRHMDFMLGCGIAFHTAFFVFGARRLINLNPTGVWTLIPWILPTAIGAPVAAMWVRHYKRKFGDLPSSKPNSGETNSNQAAVDPR